ncbi:conserved virulence factor C family protein [Paenibacillus sp. MBLB4367]|uniref:conserved virulence factor C family protein n=1 Tax=Paenibacillus sp. MBLB4367 TaxID=3384767 RepID=UPI0039080F30
MKIVSIEPTPSPNSMKLNMDEKLNPGVRLTYAPDNAQQAPAYVQRLLEIPGVTGLFQTADFIALDRHPKGDWQAILGAAREVLGEAGAGADGGKPAGAAAGESGSGQPASQGAATPENVPPAGWGEVNVLVQMFRGIPMQVRVQSAGEERRAALPERFAQTAVKAGAASPNLLYERKLVEQGVRYGELADVLDEVVRELDAAYDAERLDALAAAAQADAGDAGEQRSEAAELAELEAALEDGDWRKRYAALQRLTPTIAAVPLLARALSDAQMSVRRLAVVYLGDIKEPETLPHLFRALKDSAVAVRRTAGDTLSDLGDPAAIGPMSEALRDPNKLVRWRAARYLFETGDDTALNALHQAKDDPEFEVRMQINMAIERIEGGEAASGSVWQQMTNRSRE